MSVDTHNGSPDPVEEDAIARGKAMADLRELGLAGCIIYGAEEAVPSPAEVEARVRARLAKIGTESTAA